MRVGVLGASGYVGSNICRYLSDKGFDVVGIVRTLSNDTEFQPQITLNDFVAGKGGGVDAIVNCIGLAHARFDDAAYDAVEVKLLAKTVAAANEQGVSRFVHIGSVAAQFGGNTYGLYKRRGEKALSESAGSMDYVILRPTMIYGAKAPGHPAMLQKFLARNLPIPFGRVETSKSVLYIGNLCFAVEAALGPGVKSGRFFSVSDPGSVAFNRFVELYKKAMGSRSALLKLPVGQIALACSIGSVLDRIGVPFPANKRLLEVLKSDTSVLENPLNAQVDLPFTTEQAFAELARKR